MITAIIRNKENTLVLELPHSIYDIYLERHEGMTMAEFITLAVDDELHPKIQQKEGNNMGNMRTMAFQVPEELFQRIKDYLHRNNIKGDPVDRAIWLNLPMASDILANYAAAFNEADIGDCVYYDFESVIPQITPEMFGSMSNAKSVGLVKTKSAVCGLRYPTLNC